jgi:hypothetical protein
MRLELLSDPEWQRAVRHQIQQEQNHAALHTAFNTLLSKSNALLSQVTIELPFLQDELLSWVIEFLTIPFSDKCDHMFSMLPNVVHVSKNVHDIKTMVDPSLHPYIDFIFKFNQSQFVDLATAAVRMGVDALCVLVGVRFAFYIDSNDEATIRSTFAIPERFKDAVKTRLQGSAGSASTTS